MVTLNLRVFANKMKSEKGVQWTKYTAKYNDKYIDIKFTKNCINKVPQKWGYIDMVVNLSKCWFKERTYINKDGQEVMVKVLWVNDILEVNEDSGEVDCDVLSFFGLA